MEKQRKGQLDPSFTLLTVHIISKKLAYVHTMILLPQLFFIKLKWLDALPYISTMTFKILSAPTQCSEGGCIGGA